MNGYERVCAMLQGKAVDSLPFMPITMMFATDCAGIPYRDYAADHRKLVEAQLCVAERFDIDHVSCISDPAREAGDCGAAIEWFDDQPPAIDESHAVLSDKTTFARLKQPDPTKGRMLDRVQGVALFREQVGGEKFIEGWVEGPCAECADLRGINHFMMDLYEDPIFARDLIDFVMEMEIKFAQAQVDAGADVIGVGDAAASLIGPALYEEFIFPHEKRLVDAIHDMGCLVRLHICGNTTPILHKIGELGCDIVDLDFLAGIGEARMAMGPRQVLLGNIDPVRRLRDSTPEHVYRDVAECHRLAGKPYIASAGCEVPRDTPHANLRAMHDYARNNS
ncbi:MAG: uroporphyrinogen decarboxylase family protein [Candidatus Hydrogenedentes bacterium]|nr:uroporphyrinogen decarboxylase family protein [Candidatus Hydrogenedentota bacterium]